MLFRLFLSSVFSLRNIAILLIFLGVSYVSAMIFPQISSAGYIASVATYFVFIVQNLFSKRFKEEFNHKEKVRHIQDLNFICLKLFNEAKKNTNTEYLQKLRKVMSDKTEIVSSFFRGEKSYLKEKIVEQTLKLVASYIKLVNHFSIRDRELNQMDIGEIADRINANRRKIEFIKDFTITDDINKVIEMDEKLINGLKEEKSELQRISAKLDYMGGTVNMFKHQIISSIEQEETLEKLESVVNEATALDNVLYDRQKNKLKL